MMARRNISVEGAGCTKDEEAMENGVVRNIGSESFRETEHVDKDKRIRAHSGELVVNPVIEHVADDTNKREQVREYARVF